MPPVKSITFRRIVLLLAAAAVTFIGLVLHFLSLGDMASLITDALYTVLVYLVLAIIAPRAKRLWLAVIAFVFSALIELSQLTGVPAQLAESFPASSLIFGTTFSALDLVAYAVGAGAAYFADRVISARGPE